MDAVVLNYVNGCERTHSLITVYSARVKNNAAGGRDVLIWFLATGVQQKYFFAEFCYISILN